MHPNAIKQQMPVFRRGNSLLKNSHLLFYSIRVHSFLVVFALICKNFATFAKALLQPGAAAPVLQTPPAERCDTCAVSTYHNQVLRYAALLQTRRSKLRHHYLKRC